MSSRFPSDPIVIEDSCKGYPLTQLCVPKHYEPDLSHVLISNGLIMDRIERLAEDIKQSFGSEPLVCLCVLKGAYKFFSDLVHRLNLLNSVQKEALPLSVEFIRLRSYQDDKSTNTVQVLGVDNLAQLRGKNVLIVEDIVDTGRTIRKLLDLLEEHSPKEVKVASLLLKRTPLSSGFKPDFTGFEIPDMFIVGYALDYNEYFRDLSHICVINEEGKKRYSS